MHLLHATLLTIFPEMFPGSLQYSLAGQALHRNIWSYDTINIRDFGITKHKNVDDTPYGGGSGLIIRPDVLGPAIDHAILRQPGSKIYYPSPRGELFTQSLAHQIIKEKNIIIVCGRFEGIDERVIEEYNMREISVGDYILSGGEVAALTILDCLVRLLPGVVANRDALESESFEQDGESRLEAPLYTKPSRWKGRDVPAVLLSGNHQKIEQWRRTQSALLTRLRRPDLLES